VDTRGRVAARLRATDGGRRGGAASGHSGQYTGRENNQTGLYYYRARYYSPSLRRFISEDPIGLAGGINAYAYAGDDPVQELQTD
jgi:RHS repeat-associated protein